MNIKEISYQIIENFKIGLKDRKHTIYMNEMLYIAIDIERNIKVSITSNILENAYEAILILAYEELAVINYYYWYNVYHINSEGEVSKDYQNDKFRISHSCINGYKNQYIDLLYDNTKIYSFRISHSTWSGEFKKLWSLFNITRQLKTEDEILLACKLYRSNSANADQQSKIEELCQREYLLESQLKEYRGLLDEFKSLLNSYIEK
ncbi:hypothetical protein [uncultured Duncaniella sp.]|uniref:hypothetical protein n=1 Tax=uncultured Duncaniella sp. TaxID=2768039 RepID=UPI00267731BC|nr:hypothetical protein [uncultured Duncaniella sp.]MCI9172527.1 hypothetical protein [Muribaculaceae bacterium]